MTSLLQMTGRCSISWASSSAEKPAIGTTGEKGPKGPGPKDPKPKGPDPCATASSSLRLCSHFFVAASVGPSASYVRRSTWMAKGSGIGDLGGGQLRYLRQ